MNEWVNVQLGAGEWVMLALCAVIVGMAKTGVAGIYTLVVPVLALIFGGRVSTGVLLPILILSDIFAVVYYHRAAAWSHILRLLPWAIGGIVLATWVGSRISDTQFKIMMGALVLLGITIMLVQEFRNKPDIPTHPLFGIATGLLGGFATMAGNAAGPVMAVYLLAMRLPKNTYIGTGAWFFMIINLSKVPFHVFVWHTITWETLRLDLLMLPAIALGAWAGIQIVRRLPERFYRRFVLVATTLSAVLLFF
ncbi:MAG: sulfite exporter TauE/SafE family protein [Bacteroidia bacterium]